MRPPQWVKNGFIFAALIFSQSLTRWDRCRQVLLATLIFCVVSSATYILNDILDASEDRHHPTKKLRPIASGRLSTRKAGAVGAILACGGLLAAWKLDSGFLGTVAAYLAINILYSLFLKHVLLLTLARLVPGLRVAAIVANELQVLFHDLDAFYREIIVCQRGLRGLG